MMKCALVLFAITSTTFAEPASTKIGTGLQNTFRVVVDADHICWSTDDPPESITCVAKRTGVASMQLEIGALAELAIHGDHVYAAIARAPWSQQPSAPSGSGRIVRIAKLTGHVEELARDRMLPRSPAVDATHVYFADDKGVHRIAKTAGAKLETISSNPNISLLVVDDKFVYAADQGPVHLRAGDGGPGHDMKRGRIVRFDKVSTAEKVLVARISAPTGLAQRGERLFVSSYSEYRPTVGLVLNLSKAGGRPTTLARNLHRPEAVHVDDTHLYWFEKDRDSIGSIRRLRLGSRKVETFVERVDEPSTLASDDGGLYVASHADQDMTQAVEPGSVMRYAKRQP